MPLSTSKLPKDLRIFLREIICVSAFKTCYTIFDVTANLLISREVVAFSRQFLEKGGLFSPLLWLLWRKWRDLLQRERGIYCGERGEVLRRNRGLSLASHVAGRSTKKKTTRCPKTCVVFSLVIRKLSFLFELCVFFSEQCILTSDITSSVIRNYP